MAPLANFIKFLEENGLVRFTSGIGGDDMKEFMELVKIQGYAYLAKRFGLDLPYKHSIYVYGPYSETLGQECRSLAQNIAEYEQVKSDLDRSFDADMFLRAVRSKDFHWLDIATSLIKQSERYPSRDGVIHSVFLFKDKQKEYISKVLSDIEEFNLIKLPS